MEQMYETSPFHGEKKFRCVSDTIFVPTVQCTVRLGKAFSMTIEQKLEDVVLFIH